MSPDNQTYFKNLPVLELSRLVLRPVRENDLQDIWEYVNDPKISRYTAWSCHQEIETTKSYLNKVLKNYSDGNTENWGLELKSTGKFIGMAGFAEISDEHNRGEIGYVLSRNYWNQGLISEAIHQIVREGFCVLNLEKILGRCISENFSSKRVLEKSGFLKEGHFRRHYMKDGILRDIEVFGILRQDFQF